MAFLTIPREIIEIFLSLLDPVSLGHCFRVNKRLLLLAKQKKYWLFFWTEFPFFRSYFDRFWPSDIGREEWHQLTFRYLKRITGNEKVIKLLTPKWPLCVANYPIVQQNNVINIRLDCFTAIPGEVNNIDVNVDDNDPDRGIMNVIHEGDFQESLYFLHTDISFVLCDILVAGGRHFGVSYVYPFPMDIRQFEMYIDDGNVTVIKEAVKVLF